MKISEKKGFTLIELLVVVAIIGLLATISIVSLGSARDRAKNTRRIADIRQLQTALELYFYDFNRYPVVTEWVTAQEALATAEFSTYLSQVPSDPSPGEIPIYDYSYLSSPDGSDYQIIWYLTDSTADFSQGYQASTPNQLGLSIEISDTGLLVEEDQNGRNRNRNNNGLGQWLSDLIRDFLGVNN